MNRIILIISLAIVSLACSNTVVKNSLQEKDEPVKLITNPEGKGQELVIEFRKGSSFYYPMMAFWIEDEAGRYIQTLYVSKSVATGIFNYAQQEKDKWIRAPKRAPQTLPYWAHKRGIRASDGLFMPEPSNPVADAYSGATPVTAFTLVTRADERLPDKFRLMMEINQNWDWNEYWTNDKYPGDENYKMSCQPALVYEALVENYQNKEFHMKAIGHSHYSGMTGELFTDLSTITTALDITGSVTVRIKD
jgi:hypothetical protein